MKLLTKQLPDTVNPERTPEIRGVRDLVALWRELPSAVFRYPASELPPGLGLAALSDTLRAHAWREHCAAATPTSCAESGRSCVMTESGRCRADALFPVQIGGGAPSWRMATLFVQWRPSLGELRLIALGETACAALGWAVRCLRERHRLEHAEPLDIAKFADLELTGATRWRLGFVTPWVVGKNVRTMMDPPDAATVERELGKSMRARAHKLTALCAHESIWQRIGAHLAHHVADVLLPAALTVEQVAIEVTPLPLASRGNASTFEALAWNGEVTLRVEEVLLPWLSLLAICGGGENADKGFGGVELIPL